MTGPQLITWLVCGVALAAFVAWRIGIAARPQRASRVGTARAPELSSKISASSAEVPVAPVPSSKASAASTAAVPPAEPASSSKASAASSAEVPAQPPQISGMLADLISDAQRSGASPSPQRPSVPSAAHADEASAESRVTLIYEPGAEEDEPTAPFARIVVAASGDSDCGLKRRSNEDSFLVLPERGVFVVADGMGGHKGGQLASSLAVDAMREAFETEQFDVDVVTADGPVPRRGRELASAVSQANRVIFRTARSEPTLADMGTTLVALRFAPNKQRLYVGHVGDSRCYRLRGSELRQLTTDHVMRARGMTGPRSGHLFNAVGLRAALSLDLVIDRPRPGDVYLLCSDGLPKMVSDESIRDTLIAESDPEAAVYTLIEQANDAGGKDNVTVLLAKVLAESATEHPLDSRSAGQPPV